MPQPSHADGRERGTVNWFNANKGFGFIVMENGDEIIVHSQAIEGSGKGRRSLRDGQPVSFVVRDSERGPQAEEVKAL
ncbi:MAG: cold-shock protein [Candidatus Tectomicrobia bacterium]|nr:cold-shock protein [Candidatus Tectomicrobia bacterium]